MKEIQDVFMHHPVYIVRMGICHEMYGSKFKKNCLVHGKLEFVDDADVRRPSDDERREEVDDVGSQHINIVRLWIAASKSRPSCVHIRPHEHRDVERNVVDPYADDNHRSYTGFQS